MNAVNLHLLVNHWGLIAFTIALPLGLWAYYADSKTGLRLYYLLCIAAFISLFVAIATGDEALHHASHGKGFDTVAGYAEMHEEMAEDFAWVFWLGLGLTGLALYGHLRPFRYSHKLFFISAMAVVFSLVVIALIAHTGGEIRHPDVRW